MVKVGLEISSSKLKYDKKPSVNFVFPEPKSPVKTIISLLLQIFAKFAEIEEWISGSISFGDTYLQKGENMRLLQQRFQLKSPVYIGDTDGDGVQARLAGWPFVFVRYGFGSTDRFDLAFDSFSELTDYFMNLS